MTRSLKKTISVRPGRTRRVAMTYVELLVSFAILGTAVAASLQAISGYAIGAHIGNERAVGLELANQLMAEVNALSFREQGGGTAIGIEAGEAPTNRTTFDDIDDYNGYTESPPTDRTGRVMTEYAGYRRDVAVAYDSSLETATGGMVSAEACKRITVVVYMKEREVARLVTVRTANNAAN